MPFPNCGTEIIFSNIPPLKRGLGRFSSYPFSGDPGTEGAALGEFLGEFFGEDCFGEEGEFLGECLGELRGEAAILACSSLLLSSARRLYEIGRE